MKKFLAFSLLAFLLVGCEQAQDPVEGEPPVEEPTVAEVEAEAEAELDLLAYLNTDHPIQGVDFEVFAVAGGGHALILVPQDEEWDLRFRYQIIHDQQREYADIVLGGLAAILEDLGTDEITEAFWQPLTDDDPIDLFLELP